MTSLSQQLDTWSNQGATTTAQRTHKSIRRALDDYDKWPEGEDYNVYLQGSYKNSTNIYGDSDVDVVVELTSTYRGDLRFLTEAEKRRFRALSQANYSWSSFYSDVLHALNEYYGSSLVTVGSKCIKVDGGSSRLDADVLVCMTRRVFIDTLDRYIEGIIFKDLSTSRWIRNYPKLHYENGTNKSSATSGMFKPTVRVFKNMREHLVKGGSIPEGIAPSYFIECLLWNVPNTHFHSNYEKALVQILAWLITTDLEDLYVQHKLRKLFGPLPQQWNLEEAELFYYRCTGFITSY